MFKVLYKHKFIQVRIIMFQFEKVIYIPIELAQRTDIIDATLQIVQVMLEQNHSSGKFFR